MMCILPNILSCSTRTIHIVFRSSISHPKPLNSLLPPVWLGHNDQQNSDNLLWTFSSSRFDAALDCNSILPFDASPSGFLWPANTFFSYDASFNSLTTAPNPTVLFLTWVTPFSSSDGSFSNRSRHVNEDTDDGGGGNSIRRWMRGPEFSLQKLAGMLLQSLLFWRFELDWRIISLRSLSWWLFELDWCIISGSTDCGSIKKCNR